MTVRIKPKLYKISGPRGDCASLYVQDGVGYFDGCGIGIEGEPTSLMVALQLRAVQGRYCSLYDPPLITTQLAAILVDGYEVGAVYRHGDVGHVTFTAPGACSEAVIDALIDAMQILQIKAIEATTSVTEALTAQHLLFGSAAYARTCGVPHCPAQLLLTITLKSTGL